MSAETIPDEFLKAADRAAASCFSGTSIRSRQGKIAIAKAIHDAVMAERDRCAVVLENTSGRLRVRRSGLATEIVAGVLNDCATVIRMPAAPKAEG